MVETHIDTTENQVLWVVAPTRSLSWPEARRWLCVISLIPLASGGLFWWFGAPFVLPFAGLEVALLWAAFYYVFWQGAWREVIELSPTKLVVRKGRHTVTERREFDPCWVRVELAPGLGWRPNSLCLRSHGQATVLGDFLTDGERQLLAKALINALAKSR
ncbi:MAG: DUF2244 domain-containing protein [Gammaproteobacteria bacterium]|nr:DUF2244 domain-containing protein [Gammaproteobacteria bacterium]